MEAVLGLRADLAVRLLLGRQKLMKRIAGARAPGETPKEYVNSQGNRVVRVTSMDELRAFAKMDFQGR